MRLIAIMPVRSEDWILGLSLRALLLWCDEVIVGLHACTDRSQEIAQEVAEETARVTTSVIGDDVWHEMSHRQGLLNIARDIGATHIAIVDADELLTANLLPLIRGAVTSVPQFSIFQLPWICLAGDLTKYWARGVWGEQQASAAFQDHSIWHWKAQGKEGYEHHHRHPMGKAFVPWRPVSRRDGGLMHLQFLSRHRLMAKQALYKIQEAIRWPGREPIYEINQKYDYAVYGGAQFQEALVPAEWWHGYEDLMDYLHIDAEPWQEAEAKRLYAEHGAAKFKGLDLFGVV
jgi:hypothetical protein